MAREEDEFGVGGYIGGPGKAPAEKLTFEQRLGNQPVILEEEWSQRRGKQKPRARGGAVEGEELEPGGGNSLWWGWGPASSCETQSLSLPGEGRQEELSRSAWI